MQLSKGRRKLNTASATLVLLGCAAQPAFGQVINGDFSAGFQYWNTIGDTFVADSTIGSGPPFPALHEALLATATDGTGGYVPAGSGVGAGIIDAGDDRLEQGLNLRQGTLSNIGNGNALYGSAITQEVFLNAFEPVTFVWDFLTNQAYNDGTYDFPPSQNADDFAFVSLVPDGPAGNTANVTKFADVFTPNSITPSSKNPFIGETGFASTTIFAPSTGNFLLGFGVVHASGDFGDDGINSGVLIDVGDYAVPEPASCLVLAGFCLPCLLRRRNP